MTTESASPWRTARWRLTAPTLALLVSVCLNIGFTSYIAVQAVRGRSPEHSTPQATIAEFAARLPRRDADILWRIYRAREPQIQDAEVAAQRARIPVLSTLARHDLDTDVLRATFREALESRVRMQGLLADTVIEALEQISPEGRRKLTEQNQLR
jgi:uncharacterized membrane protein